MVTDDRARRCHHQGCERSHDQGDCHGARDVHAPEQLLIAGPSQVSIAQTREQGTLAREGCLRVEGQLTHPLTRHVASVPVQPTDLGRHPQGRFRFGAR